MTTARRTILIGSSALLVTALLSGCSLPGGDLGGLIPSHGPAALSNTATPTPTALAGDTNGDGKLSEFEKQILAQNAPKDYALADGTVVSIDPKQPLPAAVVAEIQAAAAPAGVQLRNRSTQSSGNMAIKAVADSTAAATGKRILFVMQTWTVNDDGSNPRVSWGTMASGVRSTGILGLDTKDEMMAAAQTWGGTRGYEIIVVEAGQ